MAKRNQQNKDQINCCAPTGRCNRKARMVHKDFNPRTDTWGQLAKMVTCIPCHFSFNKGSDKDNFVSIGQVISQLKARDQPSRSKPQRKPTKQFDITCDCESEATRNFPLDPYVVDFNYLKDHSVCDKCAEESGKMTFPLERTIRLGGGLNIIKARLPMAHQHVPEPMEFAAPQPSKTSKQVKAAQQARKREKSLAAAAKLTEPNKGSGDISQLGHGRAKKKSKNARKRRRQKNAA